MNTGVMNGVLNVRTIFTENNLLLEARIQETCQISHHITININNIAIIVAQKYSQSVRLRTQGHALCHLYCDMSYNKLMPARL